MCVWWTATHRLVSYLRQQLLPSALCLTCCFHISAKSSHLVKCSLGRRGQHMQEKENEERKGEEERGGQFQNKLGYLSFNSRRRVEILWELTTVDNPGQTSSHTHTCTHIYIHTHVHTNTYCPEESAVIITQQGTKCWGLLHSSSTPTQSKSILTAELLIEICLATPPSRH